MEFFEVFQIILQNKHESEAYSRPFQTTTKELICEINAGF